MDDRPADLRTKVLRRVDRAKDTRAARALAWYGARRGALLCGGIAYSAVFSLAAALTIGFSVFFATLGNNAALRQAVFDQIDTWLPGLLVTGDGTGGVLEPDNLVLPSAVNVYSLGAAVVLLFTATGFMRALRVGVRAMFDVPAGDESLVLSKVWELLGFAILGVMVLASAAASIVSQTVNRQVEELLGTSTAVRVLLTLGTAAVGVVLDALLVYLVVRVVARVRPVRTRDLLLGCLAAGLVASALRWLGTSVVAGTADRNPLLASFAVLATVLVLVNFVARVLLLVCAWMYDPPRVDEVELAEEQLRARRHAAEVDRIVRRGQGSGRPWSPLVRGVRRARLAVPPR
ncbi:YihY/virulence factor BrkB family protein [Isoptericola variabilis]|uniref:Ribonuclease BN n=1 Tax=Isoptericola variabilis (strain 225) TaxID=743718 RepID=F6FPV2_ISOV2|nr:YhjD/YihY/BrkB family envelope integrity protein [Isoptericola variabilis]AEG43741.1 ribonuclease BN [Isoptericola variabilis 225]TWH27421.1 membrane protein [Isoptericola variabilis J7]